MVTIFLWLYCILFLSTLLAQVGDRLHGDQLLWTYIFNNKHIIIFICSCLKYQFNCCGINSGKDFMTSWWRLRELAAPNLLVPLSCCHPDPNNPEHSFLDPQPLNETLCQDKQPENFILARYTEVRTQSYLPGWVWKCNWIWLDFNSGNTILSGHTQGFQESIR